MMPIGRTLLVRWRLDLLEQLTQTQTRGTDLMVCRIYPNPANKFNVLSGDWGQ